MKLKNLLAVSATCLLGLTLLASACSSSAPADESAGSNTDDSSADAGASIETPTTVPVTTDSATTAPESAETDPVDTTTTETDPAVADPAQTDSAATDPGDSAMPDADAMVNQLGDARGCESGYEPIFSGASLSEGLDANGGAYAPALTSICRNVEGDLRYFGLDLATGVTTELPACQQGAATWIAQVDDTTYTVVDEGGRQGALPGVLSQQPAGSFAPRQWELFEYIVRARQLQADAANTQCVEPDPEANLTADSPIIVTQTCADDTSGPVPLETTNTEEIDDLINTFELCEGSGGLASITYTANCPAGPRDVTVNATQGQIPDIATIDACE